MNQIKYRCVFSIFIFLLTGCRSTSRLEVTFTASPEQLSPPVIKVKRQNVDLDMIRAQGYPHVDGSTSTYPLQMMIACHVLDVACNWTQGDLFDPTHRIAPDFYSTGDKQAETLSAIFHSGTHSAYMNLIKGNADLILVAREPSEDERRAAAAENLELDVQPIARDAFVFLVHDENPVESLSLERIRDIYTGRVTNWIEVGGVDAEIHTYQRNPNSGSQELMERLVMLGEAMLDSPDMMLETMMGPINAIRDNPLGIGYSVYFYAAKIYPDENVRMIAVEGIEPTSETIADRIYPLSTKVYAVLREGTPQSSAAITLRDWLFTEEGQGVVKASGYVPYRSDVRDPR
jgi:phosphate transport system substrate-binding protein